MGEFDIRGWLTRMNNSDVSITENGPRDYFGMNLFYNETVPELSGYQAQFNGNISAMKWSTNLGLGGIVQALEVDGPKENAYAFRYDSLNRLKSAAFHTKPSTGWGASAAYHEDNLKYDRNGNIKSLNRTTTEGTPMDQLTYAYSGNQLLKVSDTSDKTKGFVDGPSPDNDYTYDANGNMTLDRNKEITAITYNHLNLPDKVTKSTGEYVKYTYDATGRKLSQGVYNASNVLKKKSDYAGEFFYENDTLKFVNHEEGRVVMTGTAPEYQYHLKDHLGNVRMTFTTKEEVDDVEATMETASAATEHGQFLNYDEAVKVNSTLFNHTPNGTTHYSTRLRGSTNEQYGLAKSLSVMPGDTIRIEVFAKYIDPNTANWQQALSDLVTSIAHGTAPAGTVVDGGVAGSIGNTTFPYGGLLEKTPGGTPPKAFLNYIMFDRDVNPILDTEQTNFIQVSELAREDGSNGDHEHLYVQVIAKQAGLMYIYLSNDNVELGGSAVEVFFDDFKIEHIKSPVVQMDDYYPFGLTFNSYRRENSLVNKYKFQGQEHIEDLGLGWVSFKWRNAMPAIGRFFNIDPLSEEYYYNSPYAFSENKVTAHIELEGLESWYAADGSVVSGPVSEKTIKDLGLRAAQGVSAHAGYTGIQSQRVRAEYRSRVSQLDPTDSKGRTQAKIDAREKTPAITRTMAEKMRPIGEEGSRIGGTANKTNVGVNSKVEIIGKIGKLGAIGAGIASIYNVAKAEDKGKAIITEGGAIGGAIVGGEIGAGVGSIASVPGAIVGGAIGSIAGSIAGESIVEGSMSSRPAQSNLDSNGNYLVPSDATNRIQVDKPIIKY